MCPMRRTNRTHPDASASPHILPIFEMDMRARRQPERIGMIRGIRLGHVFPSLSCPVTDRTRLRAYKRWFEGSDCRCSYLTLSLWYNHPKHMLVKDANAGPPTTRNELIATKTNNHFLLISSTKP